MNQSAAGETWLSAPSPLVRRRQPHYRIRGVIPVPATEEFIAEPKPLCGAWEVEPLL